MTIIGELGKLLTYEIRLDRTEPGADRMMYNSKFVTVSTTIALQDYS